MSAAKHTPGPWQFARYEGNDLGAIYDVNGRVVCDFGDYTQYDQMAGKAPSEADARLIEAAPELYEACVRVLAALRFAPVDVADNQTVDALAAAIAKAEGRSEVQS